MEVSIVDVASTQMMAFPESQDMLLLKVTNQSLADLLHIEENLASVSR